MPLDPNKLQAAADAYQPDNSRLRSVAADSMSLSPDAAARASGLATRNGWRPQVVASDIPGFEAEELNRQLDDLHRDHPKVGEWLADDPTRMSLVRDDLDGTRGFAKSIDRIWNSLKSGAGYTIGGALQEFGELNPVKLMRDRVMLTGGAMYAPPSATGQLESLLSPGRASDRAAQVGADIYDTGTAEAEAGMDGLRHPSSVVDAITNPRNTAEYYLNLGAQSVWPMGVSLLGGEVGGPLLAGVTAQPNQYGSDRADGMDEATALQEANVNAAIEALTEIAPFQAAFQKGRSFLGRFGRTAAAESVSEGVAQTLQDESQVEFSGQPMTWQQRASNIIDAMIVGFGMAAPMATVGAAHETAQANREADRKRSNAILTEFGRYAASADASSKLDALTKAAQAMKLGQRSPAAAEALTSHLLGDTANVYIAADEFRTLFQQDAPRMAAEATGNPDALAEAGETGDVVIPMAKYVSTLATSPQAEQVAQVARLNPEHLSRKELESTDFAAALDDAGGKPADEAQQGEVAEIETGLHQALMGTGAYNDADAKLQARIVARMFSVLAQRSGTSPKALAQRYNLTIGGRSIFAEPEQPTPLAKVYQRGNGRTKDSAQAVQLPDGSWRVRNRAGNQWQEWRAVDTFDPSPTFGYRETGTGGGSVNIPGVGKVATKRNAFVRPADNYNPLLDLIAGAGGISKADGRFFGLGDTEMQERRGIRPLFSDAGIPLDKLREMLLTEAYLPPEAEDAPAEHGLNDVWDLVDRALRGERVGPMGDEGIAQREELARALADLDNRQQGGEADTINDLVRRALDAGALPWETDRAEGQSDADYEAMLRDLVGAVEGERALAQQPIPDDASVEYLRQRIAELETELRTDRLTGMRNQRAFDEDEALGWPSVAAADMDGLKRLNDAIGHEHADTVLRALGAVLLDYEVDGVRFYRRSGDEFAARFADPDNAAKVMADVQQRLEQVAIDIDVAGLDGAVRSLTYNGIGLSYGLGENYESADAQASENKRDRLAAGIREEARSEGEPRRLQARTGREGGGGESPVPRVLNQNPAAGGVSVSQTDTPAFKRWFGDSKVVDADGKPLVVYHGTADDFDQFRVEMLGHATRAESANEGFFFVSRPDVATGYAHHAANIAPVQRLLAEADEHAERDDWDAYDDAVRRAEELEAEINSGPDSRDRGQNIMPVYLSLQNPAEMDAAGESFVDSNSDINAFIARAKRDGHDGVIIRNLDDDPGRSNMVGDHYIAFRPEQIKSATGNRGTFDPNDPRILNQPAYHGTPHTVDRFSLQKIGTGEGAQAYGWGLYFASEKDIAKHYRDTLSRGNYYTTIDQAANLLDAEFGIKSSVNAAGAVVKAAVRGLSAKTLQNQDASMREFDTARLQSVIDSYNKNTKGNLYRVEVPEDGDLLDWDKPLSEQPEKVRAALQPFVDRIYGDKASEANPAGAALYHRIAQLYESEDGSGAPIVQQASEALAAAGIPGLRYLDGGSRNAPRIVEVMERDGKEYAVTGATQYVQFKTRAEAEAHLKTLDTKQSHNYVIWDEAAIGDHEHLLDQGGNARPNAEISFGKTADGQRRVNINLFDTANKSSFFHESSHLFLEMLGDLAAEEGAPKQIVDDYATIRAFVGAKDGEAITDAQHETFARSFELYLRSGKAPAPELVRPMARISRWLTAIYREVRDLVLQGAKPLDPDITAVMDRMLAVDDEIELMETRQAHLPIMPREEFTKLGLTDAQWEAYVGALEAARDEAQVRVTGMVAEAFEREQRAAWKEEAKAIRAEWLAALEETPAFKVWRALQAGEKLDLIELKARYSHEEAAVLRGMNVARLEGGTHPDLMAAQHGFGSGDEMVRALLRARAEERALPAAVEQEMKARHPDPAEPAELQDRVSKALYGSKRLAALEAELGLLAKLAGQPAPSARVLAAAAKRAIGKLTRRKLRPNDYLVNERRAAREAMKAAAKQEFALALRHKRDQALQAALYGEARKALDRADRQAKMLRKAGKPSTFKRIGKAGKSYVDALRALLAGHELTKVSAKTVARRDALREWVRKAQEAGLNTAVSDDLLARVESEQVTNLADLTLDQLGDLHEAVKNLLHLAAVKNRLLTSKGAMEWDEAKRLLQDRLAKQPVRHNKASDRAAIGAFQKLADAYAAGSNWVLQPETLVEWLDDGTSGPWHDLLWEPSEQAEHAREALRNKVGEQLKAAMDALPKADRKALDATYFIASLDESVTGHYILSALLNMGNAGNRDKLLRGGRVVGDEVQQFKPEQLAEMFGKLTAAHAHLAQGVWDAVNSLWPDIVKMEETVSGFAPPKVEPVPFAVRTKDGMVALRGGYFPAMYDPRGAKVGQFAEDEQAKKVLAGQTPVRAATSKGHLEARTEYAAPLLLDWHAVLTRHLDGVMSDISHRRFLAQAYRILGDTDLTRMIDNRFGKGAARGLRNAMERGAVGTAGLLGPMAQYFGPFQNLANATMTNVAAAALGLRVPLALANTATAPILAAARVKPGWLVRGFLSYYSGMRQQAETIRAMSPMMAQRAKARSADYQAMLATLRGKRGARKQMIELAMSVHQWIVPLAENAIWLSAYMQAQHGGADIVEATRMADKAIRQTQTKHTAKDLSDAEGGWLRPLMMFAGPLVVINNRLQESGLRRLQGAVHTPTQALGTWIAMAAGGALVFDLIMGRGPDDDDDDGLDAGDWLRWCAKEIGMLPFAAFPILRDIAQQIGNGFSSGNPLVEAGNRLYRFGKRAVESGEALIHGDDVDEEKLAGSALDAAGVATGIPSSQLKKSGTYLMEVGTGQHTPTNPAKEAVYFMQGPPKEE